ncbi:hypothetical protein PR048_017722 [Dryococelus australis]|uniref:Uncharacterized protein n=1 Tax=Dryococelus australis TaxID=614101 RepID=A0ABQ9HAG3_9NEOP|nr:hypothetical protein PR048_017722 [Dryococelus australis]
MKYDAIKKIIDKAYILVLPNNANNMKHITVALLGQDAVPHARVPVSVFHSAVIVSEDSQLPDDKQRCYRRDYFDGARMESEGADEGQTDLTSRHEEKRGEYGAALECKEGAGYSRENPLTTGIVRHDYHMRKSGSDPTGNRTRLALVEEEKNTHSSRTGEENVKASETAAKTTSSHAENNENSGLQCVNNNDIGLYGNSSHITDDEKERLWNNTWVPSCQHKFPVNVSRSGKRRSFQNHWFQRFEWLAYSDIDISQGTFGKTCKDAIEVFQNHSSTRYHQDCTVKAQNFLEIREEKIASIMIQLKSQASEKAENIKAKLRATVETMILCARQDIPLRGDSDGGRFTLDGPDKNDGNFRALVCFRANGGKDLVELREDFLSSVAVQYVTGAGLATTILDKLQSLGLDMNKMRGKGYDGAAAIKGVFRGCQALLQKAYPSALYTHCSSRGPNLCLSDASKAYSDKGIMPMLNSIIFSPDAKRKQYHLALSQGYQE